MGRERYQPTGICESVGRRIFSASHAASLRQPPKPAAGPRVSADPSADRVRLRSPNGEMARPVEVGAFPAEPRPQIAAIGLFVVPTISLKLLYGLIIVPAGSAGAGLDQRAAHLTAE